MTESAERISDLRRRADLEREELAGALSEITQEFERHRTRWKIFGALAGGAAAAGAIGWKLFGPGSSAKRIGRAASAASVGLGVARALVKLRRFI